MAPLNAVITVVVLLASVSDALHWYRPQVPKGDEIDLINALGQNRRLAEELYRWHRYQQKCGFQDWIAAKMLLHRKVHCKL